MNTIANIIDKGREEFCNTHSCWPTVIIMGDKWFNQLTEWNGGVKMYRLWGMQIHCVSAAQADRLELINDNRDSRNKIEESMKMKGYWSYDEKISS